MTAVTRIEKVLANIETGPLIREMVYVPERGATAEEIQAEERRLPRRLSKKHMAILKRWNGIKLDMLNIFGVGKTDSRIRRLSESQLSWSSARSNWIGFASDPAGFVYAEDAGGNVYSVDTQAFVAEDEAIEKVASDIDDFIVRFVFGADSDQFAGEEWKAKLVKSNVFYYALWKAKSVIVECVSMCIRARGRGA